MDDDEADDEGWITPGNIEAMKQATVALTEPEPTDLPVACITTDYAVQVVIHSCVVLHFNETVQQLTGEK